MPADMTDITKQPLPGGNVNKPASGTYGEGVALERLKQQLPVPDAVPAMPAGPSAMPSPPVSSPGSPPPPGLPPVLLAPTARPDVPMASPLAGVPMAQQPMTAAQRRLAVLDALVNSPDVSQETREWAQLVIENLVMSSSQ